MTISADTFDVVVVNTTLTHVPGPERLVAEAYRVLRPRGWLGVFDGDYATATVSTGPRDPLVACVDAFRESFVNDPWIVRRLPQLLRAGGFKVLQMQSHGYVEAPKGAYMLTWVERGAEVLLESGRISKKPPMHSRQRQREEVKRKCGSDISTLPVCWDRSRHRTSILSLLSVLPSWSVIMPVSRKTSRHAAYLFLQYFSTPFCPPHPLTDMEGLRNQMRYFPRPLRV